MRPMGMGGLGGMDMMGGGLAIGGMGGLGGMAMVNPFGDPMMM